MLYSAILCYCRPLSLKTSAHTDLDESESFKAANEEYKHILKLCSHKAKVPKISIESTWEILHSIRPSVSDYASITALHYLHAGAAGLQHLHSLVNGLIDDINNVSVEELNTVIASILYKRHGKPKNLADSYRTISCCTFLSKILDVNIGSIYG